MNSKHEIITISHFRLSFLWLLSVYYGNKHRVWNRHVWCILCLSVAEFATLGDMKNAITKLDNTELGGRKIRLNEDKSTGRRRR